MRHGRAVERGGGIGWGNRGLALLLACVLGALWIRNGWPLLSFGVLPDSDDMVRMAQVRDFLGGQRFTDLTQHRLGIAGSGSLHWSRLGDFGVAALILGLRPWLGTAQAEIWAAILWPLVLFFGFLLASGRLARTLGTPPMLAVLIAAFAFPAITMFVPGRIDHHGLQIVLALVLIEAVIARRALVSGVVASVMLAIGLETAPIVLVAVAVIGIDWIVTGKEERGRLMVFALAVIAATIGWFVVARTDIWPDAWCDGFTPASSAATVAAALACLFLAMFTPVLRDVPRRSLATALIGCAAIAAIWPTSSICLTGPYGPVDPVLARLWLANVEEARGLFADSFGKSLAFGGLAITGFGAALWFAWKSRSRDWAILVAFQLAAIAVALFQMRGTAIAAALAAPALAAVVAAARARGNTALVVIAWLASAGLVWSIAGRLLEDRPAPSATQGADCTAPETLSQLAAIGPGLVISTIDAGAYLLGSTGHRVLAAPYHRNNRGNRAAYDFWLARDGEAPARALKADYVLACPDAFGGIALPNTSMAVRLAAGDAPRWLSPVPLKESAARLYRVLPRPSAGR